MAIYLTWMVVFVIFRASDPQTKLMMINTILIDDDYPVLKSIEQRLQQIDGLKVLQAFTDIAAALVFLKSYGKIDLILCDIEMPDLNGMEAAPLLKPYCQRFVFLTGHKEYALAAFGVHADGYLLKPVDKKEVLKEMAEIEQKPTDMAAYMLMNNCLIVKNKANKEQQFIAIADIICIQAYGHYVNLFCRGRREPILHRDKLDNMELFLKRFGGFLRTHRSYIVAVGAIRKIQEMSVVHLVDGVKANISRNYSAQVKAWLHKLQND